ncbi:replication protein [Rheinheimera sp. MMS21-TC3]|uniref:replication protein n=1 Tax=Rheinheimera sp. MMS21-TC3 TaxID=3072790 RepID=UPI0028C3B620|nr:replication protein [Rheinheimera sp. MMS21-TC3]WNO60866.1 replication protein [Rheinheimera sp. MMS21-TC3]
MNIPNVIDFSAKRNEAKPVIADIENGYCKLANELLEEICKQDISGSQFQLLMAIVRCTYGYNKKADRVTNTYLAELTGLGLSAVKSGLKKLEERNIITIQKSGIMKLVAINKIISDWQNSGSKKLAYTRNKASIATNGTRRNCNHKKPQLQPQEAAIVSSSSRNCDHTKDNLPKTTNQRQIITSQPSADDTALKKDAAIQNGKNWGTAEDLETANQLKTILSNTLGEHFRAPKNMAAWANEVRLMRTADERNPKHMVTLFALAHTDNFWKTNIQSPAALRKHWGRLASLHSERKGGYGNGQKGITIGANGKPMTAQDWGKKARELAVKL